MVKETITMRHKELDRLQIIQDSINCHIIRNKRRCELVFPSGKLNVWCIDIEIKVLLALSMRNCARYTACVYPLKLSGSGW